MGTRRREADRPSQLSARAWFDTLVRVREELGKDNTSVVAAGVAFFAMLAIIPAITAVVSMWAVFADPQTVAGQLAAFSSLFPPDARRILEQELSRIASQSTRDLSVAALSSIVLAVWSASRATKAMIGAVNRAYDERTRRGFLRTQALGLLFTFAVVVATAIAIAAIVAVPWLAGRLQIPAGILAIIELARWPILCVLMFFGIGALYRYAPSRSRAEGRWITWGAVVATALWLLGSLSFASYVSWFPSMTASYGSLTAAVVLLLWFWISAYVVLLGAELNAEMEHQTTRDTTVGPDKPLAQRGAYVADHVGRSAPTPRWLHRARGRFRTS